MAEREEKKKKEKKRKEEGVGKVTIGCLWYHRRTSILFILTILKENFFFEGGGKNRNKNKSKYKK